MPLWDAEDFVTVYVDDLLLFASSQRLARSKKELTGKFKMCDLGEVRWFLTMEITHDRTACMITVDQRQYVHKILSCFGLQNARPVSTLMAANIKLPKLEVPTINQ